jgi:hypothetical protein
VDLKEREDEFGLIQILPYPDYSEGDRDRTTGTIM